MNFQILLSERPNWTREKQHAKANLQAVYKLNAFFPATIDKFPLLYAFHLYTDTLIVSTGQIFAESLIYPERMRNL